MDEYKWLFTLPSLLGIGLMGMMIHFMRQKIKGETLTEITAYFSDNFKSTFIAVVSTMISVATTYFTLATGQPIDLLTVFGLGYMSDSFFNKWEKPA